MLLRDFATHLKRHHLEALVAENLRLLQAPEAQQLLKLLGHYPEAELKVRVRAGLEGYLTDLGADDASERGEQALRRFQANELSDHSLWDIQLGDLVRYNAARKQALLHFLPTYQTDPQVLLTIVQELEAFSTSYMDGAFRLFATMQAQLSRLEAEKHAATVHAEVQQALNDELKMQTGKLEAQQAELERLNDELRRYNEHVETEVAKRTKEVRQFEFLVRNVTDYSIYMLDPTGHVISWNKGAEHLKGYQASEILGQHFSRFFPPEEAAAGKPERLLAKALAEGHARAEGWRVRKDGTRFWADADVTAIYDDQGTFFGFAKITRDLTERRRAQDLEALVSQRNKELGEKNAALQQANEELRQADRYKDEFLSVISHELRTPLNFITGFTTLLQDQTAGPLNNLQADYLGKILMGADRMLALVNNLLDVSRMQAGKFHIEPRETDYLPIVREVVGSMRPLAEHKQITIGVDVQVPTLVTLDGARITQVLTNLVDNAIKFTPEGGHIRLEARLEGDRLVTEITDSGPGIAESDIAKLFSPFKQLDMGSTRKAGGSGLGLSICKAIVEAHGGRIGIRSRPGEGSTFWFSVPTQGERIPTATPDAAAGART